MDKRQIPLGYIDFTQVGHATTFSTILPANLRGQVAVGDLVRLADDGVKPMLFRITEIYPSGRRAAFEMVEFEPATVPPFPDRVRAVRDWVADAAEDDLAREAMVDIVKAACRDCWNVEALGQGYTDFLGQGPVEGYDVEHDEASVEVRLWRLLSGRAAAEPPPLRLAAALDGLVDGGLVAGPFADLRAAALLVADDCVAATAASLDKYGSCRPVSGTEVAINKLWWDLAAQA